MTTPIEQMALRLTGAPVITPYQTLDQNLSQLYFNVKNYGAKGDTTNFQDGTDDTAAIQRAVDAAGAVVSAYASGSTVYFPAGMYRVTGPINFTSGHQVDMRGASTGGTAIGGFFPDYIFSNPLNIATAGINGSGIAFAPGPGVGSISYFNMSNSYINYLTSCSYTGASGTATCASGTVSGTTLTINGAITGTFGIGQVLTGTGLQSNTIIAKVLSGTGAAGSTYQLNLGATISVGVAITASEGGIVTFGITNATFVGHTIAIGDYFHVFGTYPRPYNSRYVACTGTTGTTLVGGGGIVSSIGFPSGGDPGTVTMLGLVGGGCIRSDYSVHSFIEKCSVGGANAMHLGGGTGYGIIGNGAYNVFGLSVRDTLFTSGFSNGEYGTVAAFCGETDFTNCSVFSYDKGIVASSNGFQFSFGQIESNNNGITLGLNDQLFPSTSGASVIMANHTEDVDIAVDIVGANNHFQVANQWAANCAGRGGHVPMQFTGTTVSGTKAINTIAATVVTGNTTIHSPRITNLSTVVGINEGMQITGSGIPAGSVVLTIDSASSLTFINGWGTTSDPVGASATASGVTLTLTLDVGMKVDPFGAQSATIPSNTTITVVGAVGGGTYNVTLNNATTASTTVSFAFFTPTLYVCRVGTLSEGTFLGNGFNGPNKYAAIGILNSNCTNTVFVGNTASSAGSTGVAWEVPVYPSSPSAAGIMYVGNDNPDMAFAFASLPGQPGQTLNHAAMAGGMVFDITDCSTSTFLAVANSGGSGVAAHRKVRSTPRLAITSITRAVNTATVTTTANHGLTGTQILTITGADQSDYNGSFSCDCTVAVNQFSYTVANSPTTPATGTITYGYWQVIG